MLDNQPLSLALNVSSSSGDLLLLDARALLFQQISPCLGKASLEEAFIMWLLPDAASSALNLLKTLNNRNQHTHDYRDVAALCFAATSVIEQRRQLDGAIQQTLEQQLMWMVGRQAFHHDEPADYCLDPIALLGFALGACILPSVQEPLRCWLLSFLPESKNWRLTVEEKLLFNILSWHIDHPGSPLPCVDADLADIVVALRAKNFITSGDLANEAEAERSVIALMRHETVQLVTSPYRAALRVTAFDWIRRAQAVVVPERATAEHVVRLLQGVQASLQEIVWDEKPKTKNSVIRHWNVDNEYHVQSLLWIILKPIFPDLQKESYTLPVGSKNPRTDLAIPSLKLIIEAKFMRHTDTTQKIIGQIAEDASLYLVPGSSYESIIAFIWDNVPRSEEHDILVRGITTLKGLSGAIVVSRPSFMTSGPSQPVELEDDANTTAAVDDSVINA